MLLRAHEQVFGLPLPPAVLPDVADFLATFGPRLSQALVTQAFQAFADDGKRPRWFTLRKALLRAIGSAPPCGVGVGRESGNGGPPVHRRPSEPQSAHAAERQRALLRIFGIDRGRARDAIVALNLPDAHIIGWGLEIRRQMRDGERGITAINAPGALVMALREGSDNLPPASMLRLGALTPAQWRDLVLCARAIHETSVAQGKLAQPPAWMPAHIADIWPAWAAVYTSGPARDSPARHYTLRIEGVPEALLGDALTADVDEWIQAHKASARARPARADSAMQVQKDSP